MTEPMREDWMRDLLTKSYRPVRPRPAFREGLLEELKERQRRLRAAGRDSETAVSMLLSRCYRPVAAAPGFHAGLRDALRERQRELARQRRERRRRVLSFGSGFGLAAAAAVALAFTPLWRLDDGSGRSVSPAPGGGSTQVALAGTAPSDVEVWRTLGTGLESALTLVRDTFRPAAAAEAARPMLADHRPARIAAADAQSFAGAVPPRALLAGLQYRTGPDAAWQNVNNRAVLQLSALADDDAYRDAVRRQFEEGGLALAPGSECRLPEGDYADNRLLLEDGTLLSLSPGAVCRVEANGLRLEGGPENGRRHFLVMVPDDAGSLALAFDNDRAVAVEPGSVVWVTAPSASAYAAGGAPAPIVELATPNSLAFVIGPAGVAPLFGEYGYKMDRFVTADVPGWPLGEDDELPARETGRRDPRTLVARESAAATGRAVPEGFRFENGRWVDPRYTPDQPTTAITRLSPEYLQLVRAHRQAADRFALGPNVLIGLGGVFYDIRD